MSDRMIATLGVIGFLGLCVAAALKPEAAGTIQGMILLGLGLVLYTLPSWIAYGRHHHQRAAIAAVNLLVGWTFVGWVIAFVWALTQVRPDTPARPVIPGLD
jgi:Superinfection immunity protein